MQPLIALDQLLNTFVWIRGDGFGWADETFSARLWRLHLQGTLSDKPYRFVDALFFWQQNHCYDSWLSEINRRHLNSYYLTP